jgi:murein DD-endopeptidase MepM/ murein hydrolase activator NlpD
LLFIINNSAYVVPFSAGSLSVISDNQTFPPGPGGAYPQCWPVAVGYVSQGPFCTTHPLPSTHCYNKSNAIDIAGNLGVEIYATHDGTASTYCGDSAFGNCARVVSTAGFATLYSHMKDQPLVTTGAQVRAGDVLGFVGSTGNSTGAHLHYQLYSPVDVRSVVPNYKYPGSVTGCIARDGGGAPLPTP